MAAKPRPVELLSKLTVVDTRPAPTPSSARHEALTSEFIPRSDLVLFVTSADRPFTESGAPFWSRFVMGQKIVLVINKIDIPTAKPTSIR